MEKWNYNAQVFSRDVNRWVSARQVSVLALYILSSVITERTVLLVASIVTVRECI